MTDLALICGALTATGTATVAVIRFHQKVIVPVRDSVVSMTVSLRRLPDLIAISEKLLPIVPLVNAIAKDHRPNGGSSTHDKLLSVIEGQRRIEDGLSHNRNLARVMISRDSVPHFETDGDGNCVWVNQAYLDMTGLTLEECLGRGWHNALAFEDRQVVAHEWDEAIQHGKTFIGRYRFVNVAGDQFYVRCRTTFSRNNEGDVTGSVGYVTVEEGEQDARRTAH